MNAEEYKIHLSEQTSKTLLEYKKYILKELETEKHRHLIRSMEEDLESIEQELLTREK